MAKFHASPGRIAAVGVRRHADAPASPHESMHEDQSLPVILQAKDAGIMAFFLLLACMGKRLILAWGRTVLLRWPFR